MDQTVGSEKVSRRRVLRGVGAGVAGASFVGGTDLGSADSGGPDPPDDVERYNVGLPPFEDDSERLDAVTATVEGLADSVRKTVDLGAQGSFVNGVFSAEARKRLEANPDVEYVEPDLTLEKHAQTEPWGIDRIDAEGLYSHDDVGRADEVTVAVLDTGVDDDHPDLSDVNITGSSFGTNCRGKEGADCKPNDPGTGEGYNNNSCNFNWSDDDDHGTHVAGTIAADDDTEGVVGVAPGVDILAGKVLDGCGSGSTSDIGDGIRWATDQGADVINMSLGGGSTSALENACRYAWENDVVVVASAGNDGFCTDCVGAPAKYSTVIAVSNMTDSDGLSGGSSTGPQVELTAPGSRVLSTVPPESTGDSNDGYLFFWGTSMAAPHVAGTAALVKDLTPLNDNEEIRARLRESAENVDLSPDDQGYGLVDALEATDSSSGFSDPDRPQLDPEPFDLELDHEWFGIGFDDVSDPVVVTGPVTNRGNSPVTVRLRNVGVGSAEVRLQEWNYLDGPHAREDISVAVFERATDVELDGAQAETDHVDGVTTSWKRVSFETPFPEEVTPVVVHQCVTFNGPDTVATRIRNVDAKGFEVRLQEQETLAGDGHVAERVDYLAVEPHTTLSSEADTTGAVVDHTRTTISPSNFDHRPEVLAGIQTFNGEDPCNLRIDDWDASGFDVWVDEEDSANDNVLHSNEENVGWVALEQFDDEPMTYETGTGRTDQPDADTWHTVVSSADNEFADPVVLMGPPTDDGGEATTVRVRNLGTAAHGGTAFEFQLDEWETYNGEHVEEALSYGIFEAGTGRIGDAKVEAGYRQDVDDSWQTVIFDWEVFDETPIVFTQCTSWAGDDPVTTRVRNVGPNGFDVRLQEEQANGGHFTERVDYLAIEGTAPDQFELEAGTTGDVVTDSETTVSYDGFSDRPDLLASMQTTDGADPANTRLADWGTGEFGVYIQEETSGDSETSHRDENVGYAAFEHTDPGPIPHTTGTVTTDQPDRGTWHTVPTAYVSDPVVLMGPPTHNDGDPTNVQLKNIRPLSFKFQFDEWDYLDGIHGTEDVSYGVFSAGTGTIGGATAEAGSVAADNNWQEVRFDYTADFTAKPVVLPQLASRAGSDSAAVRVRNVSTDGFEVRVQEQESKGGHTRERIDYVAVEPVDAAGVTVGRTGNSVTHNWSSVGLSGFGDTPDLLAGIQTFNGNDPCNLRVRNVSAGGFEVQVDEEDSAGDGTVHFDAEAVGYVAFEPRTRSGVPDN